MIVIGHRGSPAYEPENTLRSFKKAIELGANGIEMDVRRTKDGKLVIIHDEEVDRTTNGKGKVSEYSFEELRKLDAGNGEKIPTLEEVLTQVEAEYYLVEIKEEGYEEQIYEEVQRNKKLDQVVFVSFSFNSLLRLKGKGKNLGLIFTSFKPPLDEARKSGVNYMLPVYSVINRLTVGSMKGFTILTWTVNDIRILEKVIGYGVDGIITDRPDIMSELKRVLKH
ncbi:glycerophosphodiester phosphodiesterase [Stygiolobus caldivivus]|uniref:Glycerophosphoryl diester phosphodiesterase n=1 Tax=Stygiolobus caldivivus TaxID=2824673 RepID=A0A8D5ZK57_9CREN|nr:glycerophosphodiester phosphodiesterase family protein [Stygiolobus caldivivus]BCU71040.1 glycerophosphoryl diester phosphodiesterase [Stygiolobus caldivivus]